MKYLAWVETGNRQAQAWVAKVDPNTGDISPKDGRGFSLGAIPRNGITGQPQWGQDSAGFFVVVLNAQGQIVLARPQAAGAPQLTTLATPADPSRQFIFPSRIPNRSGAYLSYLKMSQGRSLSLWYVDTANPTVEVPLTQGDAGGYEIINKQGRPGRAPALYITIQRWFEGQPMLVHGYMNGAGKLQVRLVDLRSGTPKIFPVTNDNLNHVDDFPFFLGNKLYLLGGINTSAVGALYGQTAGSSTFSLLRQFAPKASALRTPAWASSFEPFLWKNKPYASFQLLDQGPPTAGVPGEIWIASLLDNSVLRRICGPETMRRNDPEFYIGTKQAWVYYYGRQNESSPWELHRCETGL
jgi:hypothetical protein